MDREELSITALMSRLDLGEEEMERFGGAVSQLLETFSAMMQVEVENLPPTTHALLKDNRLREDRPVEDGAADRLLANAPELEERFIVIPNVL